jgi:hypothetical protein
MRYRPKFFKGEKGELIYRKKERGRKKSKTYLRCFGGNVLVTN